MLYVCDNHFILELLRSLAVDPHDRVFQPQETDGQKYGSFPG